MLHRDSNSHKGENGKVMIIGGSRHQHGAPIMSALAAEASGVDLVFLALPARHEEVAKNSSLNFQVHPFRGDELSKKDVKPLLELLATIDCAVIGPGLHKEEALKPIRQLITGAPCRLVLDATALQPWTLDLVKGTHAVLTPHLGELERMGVPAKSIASAAKHAGATIHLKGSTDRIAGAHGKMHTVKGGNAGLTHGGTGDALAGLIAGLLAQGVQPVEACVMAGTIIKRAGATLYSQKGFAYTTRDVIGLIPHLLKNI